MSLLAPMFLFGLLAAILPWWLHRLSSEKPPAQDFSSSMFLEQSDTRSSRQTRLQYWKLLALRLLFLLMLAVLFAEPLLQRSGLISGSAIRHVILIDTSLSQSHQDRWQQTLQQATDLLDAAGPSDEAVVIAAGSNFAQAGDARAAPSIASARTALTQIEAGSGRLDYGRIASAISPILSDSPLPVHLHLVTDLQRSAMPEKFSNLAIDGVADFTIYNSATNDNSNMAISGRLEHAADTRADVSVIVQSHGDTPDTANVTISDSNGVLATAALSLTANSRTLHRFSDIDTSGAKGRLTVTLDAADKLAADNQWVIAVPGGDRTEVPLLSGNARSTANTYAVAAVEADPRFSTRRINGDSLSAANSGPLLIVPDASTLSDRAAGRLRQYLNDGGYAVIFVGNTVHSSQTRQLLGMRSLSISQSADRQLVDAASRPMVTRIDSTHPVTAGLAANWRLLTVLRNVPFNNNPDDKNLVELSNGDALLLERQIGDGKILLVASPVDTAWNTLPVDPLFVAFLIRSIDYLSGSVSSNPNRAIGEAISLPPGTQLLDPDGKPLREISELATRTSLPLDRQGIYTMRSPSGTRLLSVNNDTRESTLAAVDEETRVQWEALASAEKSGTVAGTDSAQDSRMSLWHWLLPVFAALALLESLYSHRHLWVRREA